VINARRESAAYRSRSAVYYRERVRTFRVMRIDSDDCHLTV